MVIESSINSNRQSDYAVAPKTRHTPLTFVAIPRNSDNMKPVTAMTAALAAVLLVAVPAAGLQISLKVLIMTTPGEGGPLMVLGHLPR